MKHMLWRIVSKALPICSRLVKRGMNIDPYCPRCHKEEESICHVLFKCPYANIIWRLSNTPLLSMHQFTNDVEENISLLVNCYHNTGFTEQQKLAPFWLLWRIWKARNNLVFNKFRESPSRVVLQAQADVMAWINNFANKSTQTLSSSHATPITSTWTKPPPSFVKCNFDAGFDIGTSKGIGGWIIRDHHGIAKAWGSSILPSVSTPL